MAEGYADPEVVARSLAATRATNYACVDGARVAGMAELAHALNIQARALYLEQGQSERATGPWLVRLPLDVEALSIAVRRIAWPGISVFWEWDSGEATLYRHLRSINMVEIPTEDAGVQSDGEFAPVLFRHFDPAVMRRVFAIIDPKQKARLVGQTIAVSVFRQDDASDVVYSEPPRTEPPAGFLRFTGDQVAALGEAGETASLARLERFLRASFPEPTADVSCDELKAFLRVSIARARGIGLTTERSFGQYAYLDFSSNGRFIEAPGVRDYLFLSPLRDERMNRLFASLSHAAARLGG